MVYYKATIMHKRILYLCQFLADKRVTANRIFLRKFIKGSVDYLEILNQVI